MSAPITDGESPKVDITCDGLATLLEQARKVGTVSNWIALALEWSAKADAEIRRQRTRIAELESSATARDDALASIRVFAQDCIENSHDRGHLGNLYSIRDLCDSKGETK